MEQNHNMLRGRHGVGGGGVGVDAEVDVTQRAEQGILKYAMDPDGAVTSLPSEFFASCTTYTRRAVYEAFRG